MLYRLNNHVQQTQVLVLESALTRKLIFPRAWNVVVVKTVEDFTSKVQGLTSQNLRAICMVSEDDFQKCLEVFRQEVRGASVGKLGLLVVAVEPTEFLDEAYTHLELLDAISEKDARKNLEHFLLRGVRHLLRTPDQQTSKVGQETLEQLNEIFIELSAQRNPEKLLGSILTKAIELSLADGGTLYLIDEKEGEMILRVRLTQTRGESVEINTVPMKVVENSICGYVALTGKIFNVANIQDIRPMSLPQYHKAVDFGLGETSGSLLTVPLKSGRNDILGILQLANKRSGVGLRAGVGVFDRQDESLMLSFGTQAAICLENVDLYADIQKLFEGFIKASVTAIESRDPSTGGHSERVAKICVGLARATNDVVVGVYRSVRFKEEEIRELEYAALLHDFGKIGVREEVLVKAKKLYPYQLESIRERIRIFKAAARINFLEKKLKQSDQDSKLEQEYQHKLRSIETYWEIILSANEPTVLQSDSKASLEHIRNEQLLLPDGSPLAVLTDEEYRALSVTQGSLTESERLEIESHVRHTYQFLRMIPWTRDFRHLPEIAYCHHEKLDGSGYPRGLTSHEIPLQSKIMTIADIYDALTAADRWYKEAVPTEKAIEILAHEVGKGQLDPVLFEIFVEKKIYELTQSRVLTHVA